MKTLLLAALVCLTSTPALSQDLAEPVYYVGHKDFRPFVDKFGSDAVVQGVKINTRKPDLQVNFGDLSRYGSGVIGLCESGTNIRRVTFSDKFWPKADHTQREMVIHHELGHCVLYRPHRTATFSNGTPKSMMYPSIMRNSVYQNAYAYYLNELFTFKGLVEPEAIYICRSGDLDLED